MKVWVAFWYEDIDDNACLGIFKTQEEAVEYLIKWGDLDPESKYYHEDVEQYRHDLVENGHLNYQVWLYETEFCL